MFAAWQLIKTDVPEIGTNDISSFTKYTLRSYYHCFTDGKDEFKKLKLQLDDRRCEV